MLKSKNDTISRGQLLFGLLICLIGASFYCYEFILRILPGALENELSAAMGHITATTFGQIAGLYYIAYSPMQMPVGMLMDRYGPRVLLTLACLCCALGSWMFTLTYSLLLVGCGRFLVGFGSSFAFIGVLSLAFHWLPKRFFSLAVGLITTLGMLGPMYAQIKITEWSVEVGWQRVLFIITLSGFVLNALIFLVVRDGPKGHISNTYPLPKFFHNVLKVLMAKEVWLIGLVGACLYTSLSVFGELWGKTYLEQAHHLTKVQAAHSISAVFLGWAIGAPIAGYISDKTGRRLSILLLGTVLSLVCIALILYSPGLSYVLLNLLLFFYGLFSSTEIIVFTMAKECTAITLSGTVFAATNMIVSFGGVLLQPLVGKLLDYFDRYGHLIDGVHVYSKASYQAALSVIPFSLLMVIVLAYFIKINILNNTKRTMNSL
ncbi:MAG: MFS transporter [Legionella sp.]|nr:MFS transporter [Legionella sp.]